MAESKNSFIQSKMNKDLDERLIPSNVYRDALNVAVSRSEGSDVGALESILGNFERYNGGGQANLEIIGQIVDEVNSTVYFFKTRYTGTSDIKAVDLTDYNMTIERYSVASGSSQVLVQGNFLNFSTQSPIYGVNLIEDLLFWTDNRNAPRKINITNALGYYTNEDQISVCKWAPYRPPEFINLRSVVSPSAAIRPSTMSDAEDLRTVLIGVSEISAENLAVTNYKNGDVIENAVTSAQWNTANTNQTGAWCYYNNNLGNGVTYGVLYNKWAVLDPRGLAPIGYEVLTKAQWIQSLSSVASTNVTPFLGAGKVLKSEELWETSSTANQGTNTKGFGALPSGERVVGTPFFQEITQTTNYWTKDAADDSFVQMVYNSPNATIEAALNTNPKLAGRAVRCIKNNNYNGWNGDPEFLKDKFVKFSYRFKFDDNEYSVAAPFSQDVFIPEQQGQFVNDNENQAFITTVVEFMQNSINNAVLNIELPTIDILNEYKIKAIDILFKESDARAYSVIETIVVDQAFVTNLNNTNVYQYAYQSTLPVKTLTLKQTTRVFDKVPVIALAQETSGNRVLYSNFQQGNGAPTGLNYFVDSKQKTLQEFTQYPQHSIKENRNYQVGLILADKYGRQTDIILSNYDDLKDALGNPVPGSNVFLNYKALSFADDIRDWYGDNLRLNFNSPGIPEQADSANVNSGYPGVYAKGNYYTVNVTTAPVPVKPYFWDYSNQTIVAPSAALTMLFSNIVFVDTQETANTYELYKNTGSGWIKLTKTTDYSISDATGDDDVTVTFTAAGTPIIGAGYKLTLRYTANNYNKYQTGNITAGGIPLFPDFATTYQNYYAVGIELRGLYCDYTKIETVTPLFSPVRAVTFFTKKEVASSYLFDNTGITNPTRTEPTLIADKTFATYNINPRGFYSYRIGIKQLQQDYYNVYLPGFINGYPINDNVLERGETAFTTLISDNINKIPRNLEKVGPLQDQFTSDERLWPRVVNILQIEDSSTTPNSYVYNRQFYPASSPDTADLIGTVKDVFPEITFSIPPTSPTGSEFNTITLYDPETKPYIAKFSTQLALGVKENEYANPGVGTSNFPYPAGMSLAIYETAPIVVPFEIFYESSTTDLISDLNNAIQGENVEINGMTTPVVNFEEDNPSGTVITSNIFPTVNGTTFTGATGSLISVFNFPPDASFTGPAATPNTTNFALSGANQRFSFDILAAGSIAIKTTDTFYAGANGVGTDSGDQLGSSYAGRFICTIAWTNGSVVTNETLTLELVNNNPTIFTPAIGPFNFDSNSTFIFGSQGSLTGANVSPTAINGSNRNTDNTTFGNWGQYTLGASRGGANQCWSIVSLVETLNGTATTYTNSSDIDARFIIPLTALNGTAGNANRACGFNMKVTNNSNFPLVAGTTYDFIFRNNDTSGLTVDTTVSFTVSQTSYSGSAVTTAYNTGVGFGTSLATSLIGNTSTPLPTWTGQLQNWQNNLIYLWVRLKTFNTSNQLFTAKVSNVNALIAKQGQFPDNATTQPEIIISKPLGAASETFTYTGQSLAAFGATTTQIANGVCPGMKNAGSSYDFSESALVNLKLAMTQAPYTNPSGNQTWEAQLMYSLSPSAASTKYSLPYVTGTIEPFYSNVSGGSQGSQTAPTFVPIPTGPN